MARDSKLSVVALNLAIRDKDKRNYASLIEFIVTLKKGIKVYGDSCVAIYRFSKTNNLGLLVKYTEIDFQGKWFDSDAFNEAQQADVDEVRVPKKLNPNLSQFLFKLDEATHTLAISSYTESRSLSVNAVKKYFTEILALQEVRSKFSIVTSDIIKSPEQVETILALPQLKELRIIINRPNADELDESLAQIIEERLRGQNGSEYEERIKASAGQSLLPSDRTRSLARLSMSGGETIAKSKINGVMTTTDTSNSPIIETTKYKSEVGELTVFGRLAGKIFDAVSRSRKG